MNIRVLTSTLTLILSVSIALPAAAQELVANGGFESGNFAPSWQNTDGNNAVVTGAQRTGTYAGGIGSPGPGLTSINQNITTVVGNNYTFSFYVLGDNLNNNKIQAFFGGTKVYDVTDLKASSGYQHSITYNLIATSAVTNINFLGYDSGNRIYVDDVSVVAAAAAPESEIWALLIFGFGVIGVTLRRRRKISILNGIMVRSAV